MPVISAGLVRFVPIEWSVREALIAFGADFWGIKWCFLSAPRWRFRLTIPPILLLEEPDKICSCSIMVHPHCYPCPVTHLWSLIDLMMARWASYKRKSFVPYRINVTEQKSNWCNYNRTCRMLTWSLAPVCNESICGCRRPLRPHRRRRRRTHPNTHTHI